MIRLYEQAREAASAEILKHFAPRVVTVDAYEARAINAAISKTLELVEQEVRRREREYKAGRSFDDGAITALSELADFLRQQRDQR